MDRTEAENERLQEALSNVKHNMGHVCRISEDQAATIRNLSEEVERLRGALEWIERGGHPENTRGVAREALEKSGRPERFPDGGSER